MINKLFSIFKLIIKKFNYFVVLSSLGLSFFTNPAFSQSVSPENPVVIRYGDQELTRRQFELEFELQMVIDAVQNGVPIKEQQQIMTMQYQFLEKRAHEIALLKMADQRGINVNKEQLMTGLNELMTGLGFNGYNKRNIAKLGIVDEQLLHNYMRNKITIASLTEQLKKEMEVDDNSMSFQDIIFDRYEQSGIETFPGNLRSPLSRRYQ